MTLALRAALAAALALPASLALAAAPAPEGTPAYVSAEWLAGRLASPEVAVVDARGGLRGYLAGHVPGALPLEPANLRGTEGGVPAILLPLDTVRMTARRAGLPAAAHLVVVGEETDADATYVATALRLSGYPRVSVLDGGMKRWAKEGRPVTAERKLFPAPSGPPAGTPDRAALVAFEEMRKIVAEGRALLLDVRSPDQYAAGHLPGARNRFWKKDVVPEGEQAGSLRPSAEIAPELAALGAGEDRPVVVYCNTGHMAAEAYWTLRHHLGLPHVRLYQGSWVDWSMREGTPKEVSPAPAATPKPSAAAPAPKG